MIEDSSEDEPEGRAGVPALSGGEAAAFREVYGPLRGPLKRRADRFDSLTSWLAQARMTQTPDEYLAGAIRRSVLIAIVVSLFAGVAGTVEFATLTPAVVTGVVAGVTGGLLALVGHYYYPLGRALWRRRRIDDDLPHAIVFMYVLSEGGLPLPEIMRRVADADDIYGEVSRSFESIVVDMDQFNIDTLTALDEAKRATPSESLNEFLDDLENVIESGGHLDTFLKNRSESQLEAARQEQANTIETLAAIVEGYISIVFAAPVFLITILVVMAFTGAETLFAVQVVVYLFIPVGILTFLVFFHLIGGPHGRRVPLEMPDQEQQELPSSSRVRAYQRAKRAKSIREFLGDPLPAIRQRPILSLWLTAPIAGVLWVGLVIAGAATPTIEGYQDQPIHTTTLLLVLPLLIPSVGLMAAYEIERRRIWGVKRRLPEMLEGLASATRNGIRFSAAVSLVARRSEGPLANHLRRLDNEIRVTGDVHRSLLQFATEVSVSRVNRAVTVITEGHKSTGNLADVLDISAKETRERFRLDTQWRYAMQPYVAFFIVGVLVYLFIVLMFTEVFFPIIEDANIGDLETGRFFAAGFELPVEGFETALYHSLLVQAVGNGLVMGKLIDGDLLGGLKYANLLVLVVVGVFYVV